MVADTKYKRLHEGYPKNDDLYQMLAYCVALDLATGVLIYPQHLAPHAAMFEVRNSDIGIRTLSVNLGVPFEEFDRMCSEFVARCWALAPAESVCVRVA